SKIGSGPCCAQLASQLDVILVASDDPYLKPAMQGDLDDDVRGAAEADRQQSAVFRDRGSLERAVADQSRAQQRRNMFVIEAFRQLVSEAPRHNRIFRAAAICVVPSVARVTAQVFTSTPAKSAGAIHMLQPSDANPLPDSEVRHSDAGFVHSPDDLMTRND